MIVATETERPFKEAMRVGFLQLALWMEEEYGIDRWQAFELLTMVTKIRVGNSWAVAVGVPKES